MGEWVWNVDLEGKSQIQAGELEKEVTVTIPFTTHIILHNLRIDGKGYIEINPPLHIFFLQLHSDHTLKLRYRDKYGERKLADLGKYTPNSHISITYRLVEEEAEGRLKINIDGRETTLKVLPIYEKTHHTRVGIISVYTGERFPVEQFFKLHGSITIKITSEQLPPPEQPKPVPPTPPPEQPPEQPPPQPPEQPKPTPPTPPPQPPEKPKPVPPPPKPPAPPTKPAPPSLDIKSIEIRTAKTEYLPNEQIPLTILVKLTEPANGKYPIYLNIWMVDPYGLQKPLKKTTIYTEKGENQVKYRLNLAFATTGVYIIHVDAKLDDKPEHTTQKMIRVVMKPSKPKPVPPAPPIQPPEKPTPTPPLPVKPEKPPKKTPTEALKKIAIIGGAIAGVIAIWKLFKKKK